MTRDERAGFSAGVDKVYRVAAYWMSQTDQLEFRERIWHLVEQAFEAGRKKEMRPGENARS